MEASRSQPVPYPIPTYFDSGPARTHSLSLRKLEQPSLGGTAHGNLALQQSRVKNSLSPPCWGLLLEVDTSLRHGSVSGNGCTDGAQSRMLPSAGHLIWPGAFSTNGLGTHSGHDRPFLDFLVLAMGAHMSCQWPGARSPLAAPSI